jgi:hypothetical protein
VIKKSIPGLIVQALLLIDVGTVMEARHDNKQIT